MDFCSAGWRLMHAKFVRRAISHSSTETLSSPLATLVIRRLPQTKLRFSFRDQIRHKKAEIEERGKKGEKEEEVTETMAAPAATSLTLALLVSTLTAALPQVDRPSTGRLVSSPPVPPFWTRPEKMRQVVYAQPLNSVVSAVYLYISMYSVENVISEEGGSFSHPSLVSSLGR